MTYLNSKNLEIPTIIVTCPLATSLIGTAPGTTVSILYTWFQLNKHV